MKNKLLAFVSVFMLVLTAFVLQTNAATTYTDITSASEWNSLCDQETVSGNYRLTSSISVTKTIKSFQGTFEGGGYTITFSSSNGSIPDSSATASGPFREVRGTSTINNLKTMLGKTTSVTYFGGVVGHVRSGANVTITKCGFDTYYYNAIGTTCAGGIVGLADGKLTVKNCDVSIYSSYAIKGTFAGGVVGRSSNECYVIGCGVSGGTLQGQDSSGAIALGGVIGSCEADSSVLFKNKVQLDNLNLIYPANGSVSNRGAGFLAGYFIGYASANFMYIKNVASSYTARTAYLVGTINSYTTIFNNVSETNSSSITKNFYSGTPNNNYVGGNYTVGGLSSIQTTTTSYINPFDCNGYSNITMEWKGQVYLLLNFAINIGCGSVSASGSGERYFGSSLGWTTGGSSSASYYHFSQLAMFIDSSKTSAYKYLNTISGTTVNLSEFVPARNHYTFVGWRNNSGSAITSYTMANNSTTSYEIIYGAWNKESKTIYFDVDGSNYKSRSISYDTELNLTSTSSSLNVANPTKTNYEFVRWEYKNGNKTYTPNSSNQLTVAQVNELFEINTEIRFNAIFNKTGESISVNLNGGSLDGSFATSLTQGSTYQIPANAPTKAGHSFVNYTISNGTKALIASNGAVISVSDVNEFVDAGLTVNITANYNQNVLTINYQDTLYGCPIDNNTVAYGNDYYFEEYPYQNGYKYWIGYRLTYNNQEYTFVAGDKLPDEIVNGLISTSNNTLNISLIWKNKIHFDKTETLASASNNVTCENTEIANVTAKFNGLKFYTGVRLNENSTITYTADNYYDAYIITSEADTTLNINGVNCQAEDGIIITKLNYGENEIKGNDAIVVYMGLIGLEMTLDIKCQYDTADSKDATKIRFIAIIDNVIDYETLDKGSFFITVNNEEKEFKITKLYRSISTLNENLNRKEGRYYAVYTLSDIESAVENNVEIQNIRFDLTTEDNSYSCSHDGFVLGE